VVSFEKKWYRIGKFFDFLKCHKTTGKSKKSRFLSKVIHLKKNKRIRVPERKEMYPFGFIVLLSCFTVVFITNMLSQTFSDAKSCFSSSMIQNPGAGGCEKK